VQPFRGSLRPCEDHDTDAAETSRSWSRTSQGPRRCPCFASPASFSPVVPGCSTAPRHHCLVVTSGVPMSTTTTPSPCCGPGLRVEAEPRLVSSLFVCCPMPARAAAQTRRRLRAGHRAEPVDSCRCRCLPQRARSFLCIVLTLFRRTHAELRFAVRTHTAALPSFGMHLHVHPRGRTPLLSQSNPCLHT
jgi:hypothetical protein